jgi:hypothetical protein
MLIGGEKYKIKNKKMHEQYCSVFNQTRPRFLNSIVLH